MPKPGVAEPLNAGNDVCISIDFGFVPAAKHSFDHQRGEEALHSHTVTALATATHVASHHLIGQLALQVLAGGQ